MAVVCLQARAGTAVYPLLSQGEWVRQICHCGSQTPSPPPARAPSWPPKMCPNHYHLPNRLCTNPCSSVTAVSKTTGCVFNPFNPPTPTPPL